MESLFRVSSYGVGLLILGFLAGPLHAGAGSAGPEQPTALRTFAVTQLRDIRYQDGPEADSAPHLLDLYLPKGAKDFPVLIFVHGGCWMVGDKGFFGWGSALGESFARQGIGAVMINYRLAPAVTNTEQVRDVARAVAWVHRHIARYGGRSDQIFLCGHSAGGQLVSLLATNPRYLKGEGLSEKIIKGVISVSGVYRVPEVDIPLPSLEGLAKSGLAFRFHLFDSVFGNDAASRRAGSPLCHVRPGLAPFLIIYAESELPTLSAMAVEFTRALREVKAEATLLRATDRDHDTVMFDARNADDPVGRAIRCFIQEHTAGTQDTATASTPVLGSSMP